jgi:lycopene cyclase domain-containing protein
MTYFGVLLRFIAPLLVLFTALTLYDRSGKRALPQAFRTWPDYLVLLGHIAIALIYTTPWDNYLVAKQVWWYDPNLVTGITLGWVPIEEYTFFVVQTWMTGLWVVSLMRRIPPPTVKFHPRPRLRWGTALAVGLVWVVGLILLFTGWTRGLYMALLLVWALPPIILQLGFGADILWHYRALTLAGMLPPFLYLCLVDGLAIASGTWTINPQNTIGLDLAGILPLEEITFFLVTNVLITFGLVLMLARESHLRANTRVVRQA